MSATQSPSASVSDTTVDEVTLLAQAFAETFGPMVRDEARFNLHQFFAAIKHNMGGTLIVKAPSDRVRRGALEVRYATEGITFTAGANV